MSGVGTRFACLRIREGGAACQIVVGLASAGRAPTYAATMELVYELILVLHVISWATVIGAWLSHLRPPRIAEGVPHAAAAALVTGIVLTGIASASDAVADPNNAKIGVKLIVALTVTVLAYVGYRKREDVEPGLVHAAGGLAVVNVAIAILWS